MNWKQILMDNLAWILIGLMVTPILVAWAIAFPFDPFGIYKEPEVMSDPALVWCYEERGDFLRWSAHGEACRHALINEGVCNDPNIAEDWYYGPKCAQLAQFNETGGIEPWESFPYESWS